MPAPSFCALLRRLAVLCAALLLMPLGIGCAGQALAAPAPVHAPAMTAHMGCADKRAPTAPAHDCASDCALACAALPAPPSPGGRAIAAAAEPAPGVPGSLAPIVSGPAPPPPRG